MEERGALKGEEWKKRMTDENSSRVQERQEREGRRQEKIFTEHPLCLYGRKTFRTPPLE